MPCEIRSFPTSLCELRERVSRLVLAPSHPELRNCKMIHYFHGLNGFMSSKAAILQDALGVPILAPIYHDEGEYFTALEAAIADAESRRLERGVFIGTSLGGFAAYCAARRTGGVAFLINPCLRPWLSLKGRKDVTERWLLRTCALAASLASGPAARLVAFVNEDDERLGPFDDTLTWAGITEVRSFRSGGHRAENFATEIVPEIRLDYLAARPSIVETHHEH